MRTISLSLADVIRVVRLDDPINKHAGDQPRLPDPLPQTIDCIERLWNKFAFQHDAGQRSVAASDRQRQACRRYWGRLLPRLLMASCGTLRMLLTLLPSAALG